MDRLNQILSMLNGWEHGCERLEPADPLKLLRLKADGFNRTEGEAKGYKCSKCRNKGVVALVVEDDVSARLVFRECKCMTIRDCIRKMERSGLKNIIKEYTFEKFVVSDPWQESVKTKAQEFAKSRSGWFYIGGQSGSGKTHICSAICREFLLAGMEVRYFTWRDDVVRLKSLVNNTELYKKAIDEYKKVKVLFLDDLFKTGRAADGTKQQPTVADINLAFEILNFRYNNPDLITVISSECTLNDLLTIDEAVSGRIFERCGANFLSLKPDRAKNYRLKGAIEL